MPTIRRNRAGLAMTSLVIGSPAAAQLQVIGTAVNPATGRSYALLDSSNWTQARARAAELGGLLATIRSAEENAFIYDAFSRFGGRNRNLWIGLYDPDPEVNSTNRITRRAEFVWESGEPVTYSRWSPFEPNNPSSPEPTTWEYYVHLWNPADPQRSTWNNFLDLASVSRTPSRRVAGDAQAGPCSHEVVA